MENSIRDISIFGHWAGAWKTIIFSWKTITLAYYYLKHDQKLFTINDWELYQILTMAHMEKQSCAGLFPGVSMFFFLHMYPTVPTINYYQQTLPAYQYRLSNYYKLLQIIAHYSLLFPVTINCEPLSTTVWYPFFLSARRVEVSELVGPTKGWSLGQRCSKEEFF